MTTRIDAHQHFWRYSPTTHAWIDNSMRALQRDFLPEDLSPLLTEAGFDGCIAVQAQQDVAETEWLLQLADQHPLILGVVGWLDLCAPDVGEQVSQLAKHPKLRGIRHIVQDEPDDRFMLREDFMRGIAALAEHELAYDLLVHPRQLPAAIELVRRFPQQRFVLDHLGKPPIRTHEKDAWARDIGELAQNPNVWCKLSGMVTEADWSGWTAEDTTPYLDVAFAAFGSERLMIGSDWPVCTLAGSYQQVMGIVLNYVEHLPEAERDAVLGGNAAAFYGV